MDSSHWVWGLANLKDLTTQNFLFFSCMSNRDVFTLHISPSIFSVPTIWTKSSILTTMKERQQCWQPCLEAQQVSSTFYTRKECEKGPWRLRLALWRGEISMETPGAWLGTTVSKRSQHLSQSFVEDGTQIRSPSWSSNPPRVSSIETFSESLFPSR